MREDREFGLLCKPCNQIAKTKAMKEFYAKKRATGWVPKRYKKAGQKASVTRLARLSFTKPVLYQEKMELLEKENPKNSKWSV